MSNHINIQITVQYVDDCPPLTDRYGKETRPASRTVREERINLTGYPSEIFDRARGAIDILKGANTNGPS